MRTGTQVLAIVLLLAAAIARAEEPTAPTVRPIGEYVFRGNYEIPQLRSAVEVSLAAAGAREEIKQYRAQGFSCVHKSQSAYICSKFEKPTQWPEAVDRAIRQGMASMAIQFPGPAAEPVLAFAGSQTEWLYREPVVVRGTTVTVFKLVTYGLTPEGERPVPKIVFPVSEEQAIPYADFPNEHELGLHFILSSTKGKLKLGYMVTAKLEH